MVNAESFHRRRLARQLDILVAKATRHLRRWSLQRGLHAALEPALKLLLLALAVVLALQVIALAGGLSLVLPGFGPGVLLSLCLPLVYLGIHLTQIYRVGQIQRTIALALYDRLLGLKDRLATADEFLRCRHFGAFSDAAIADAEPVIGRALDVELPEVESAWQPLGRRPRYYVCTAVVLMLLMLGVNTWRNVNAEILPEPSFNNEPLATIETSADRESSGGEYPSEDRESAKDKEHAANERVLTSKSSSNNNATRARKTSKPAETDLVGQAQSGPQSGHLPFKQSGASRGNASKSDKKTAAKDSTQVRADQNLPPESPISARQSKRQKVASSASENSANDPSQANEKGAMQSLPAQNSLSSDKPGAEQKSRADDNKAAAQSANNKEARPSEKEPAGQSVPPTSQNNRKSNSGNRGQVPRASNNQNNNMGKGSGNKGHSRGTLKKSRGVMSMILGVPTPDRIWAQPNPAPIRTTRQRTQAEEKNVDSTEAQDRSPRATPVGHLVSPQPSAWEEQLLRAYFNEQRQGDTGS